MARLNPSAGTDASADTPGASRADVDFPANPLAEAAIDSSKPQCRHISATSSFRIPVNHWHAI